VVDHIVRSVCSHFTGVGSDGSSSVRCYCTFTEPGGRFSVDVVNCSLDVAVTDKILDGALWQIVGNTNL
jgi:hypothetical protein